MALTSRPARDIIAEFISQWGFDVTEGEALTWLRQRYRLMLRRTRANLVTTSPGTTTAGVSDYLVDAIEIYEVTVGGVPFHKAPHRAQVDAARNRLRWTPRDEGLYVVTAGAGGLTGGMKLGLIPVPDTSGLVISVFGAYPPFVDPSLGTNLVIDDAYIPALQEGMAATGYARDSEQLAAADRCEARFDAACEEYRREMKRRMRAGPAQIRIR